jgi:hypothetical protein
VAAEAGSAAIVPGAAGVAAAEASAADAACACATKGAAAEAQRTSETSVVARRFEIGSDCRMEFLSV